MQETQEVWVQPPNWEDPLEKEMATHSSVLAWETPWTEEPGGLQSTGSHTVRHDHATKVSPPYKLPSQKLKASFSLFHSILYRVGY